MGLQTGGTEYVNPRTPIRGYDNPARFIPDNHAMLFSNLAGAGFECSSYRMFQPAMMIVTPMSIVQSLEGNGFAGGQANPWMGHLVDPATLPNETGPNP